MRITTLLLICLMPISALAQAPDRQRKLPITVSRETTRITEPLRDDGSVDYIAALNQQASRGVTPENNAAAGLWKALGPKDIDEDIRAEYFRMLGTELPPEKGNYFVSLSDFAGQENLDDPFYDQHDAAMSRPWSKKQYPDVARWLRANRKPLKLAVEATRRPRYYSPLVATGEHPMLVAVLLPGISEHRGIARALVARAMLQANAGEIEAARADLMACHRLARLVAQGATLIDSLVGIAIEEMALRADASLAHFGNLSADQIRALAADLAALKPLPPVVEKMDRGERYMYLDSVATIAREGPSALSGLAMGSVREKDPMQRTLETMAANALVDWDIVLRIGNSYYDRLVDAMSRPTHAECAAAMDEITEDIESLAKRAKDPKQILWEVLKAGSPRKAASKYMGNIFAALLLPALDMVKIAEDRATTNLHLTRVAVLLSAHRTEKGAYPEKLAELEATDDLLKDPYGGKPFGYRRQRDGYLLYSVGPNAIDDRGRNSRFDDRPGSDPDHDDLALRMPPRKP